MAKVITVEELVKTFYVRRSRAANGTLASRMRELFAPHTEAVNAVDRVSFSIEQGERVAFIGPNGAGKSTTLKLLSGILYPDAGHAQVLGHVPWKDRKKLGFSWARCSVNAHSSGITCPRAKRSRYSRAYTRSSRPCSGLA